MPAEFQITSPKGTLNEKVYKAFKGVRKVTHGRNLDVIRAALQHQAANNGVKVEILPLTADTSSVRWSVLLDGTEVGSIIETGISKRSTPLVCPACGKPNPDGKVARTNAHDVVSASIWRGVFDEIFNRWLNHIGYIGGRKIPAFEEQIVGVTELKSSLLAVSQGTTRSSYDGAATQGDRRTCKSCELLQGGLSLIQRVKTAQEFSGVAQKDASQRLIGRNHGGEADHLGYKKSLIEEITRVRIEDVVRGIAIELNNQYKYKQYNAEWAEWEYKPKFQFMHNIGFDGNGYFRFLDDIRETAYQRATLDLSGPESTRIKKELGVPVP